MTVAIVYVRLSEDRHDDELGITRQLEDCKALIERRGWDLGPIFSDNDTSAKGHVRRPGFDDALAQIESGGAQVLVAWNLDRLSRNRRDTPVPTSR